MRTPIEIQQEGIARHCHTRVRDLPQWAYGDGLDAELLRISTRIYEVWCDGFCYGTFPVTLGFDLKLRGIENVDAAIRRALKVTEEERAALQEYMAGEINPPSHGHPQP